MNFKKLSLSVFAFTLISLTSCTKDEEETPALVVPTTYDSAAFTANTVAEYELRTNFANFINEAKKGRVSGTVVTEAKLKELFEAGTNSISANATPTQRAEYLLLFAEIEKASKGAAYQIGKAPSINGDGGVAGGYLFDETGLELEQIIDKGSFGSIFYVKALSFLANPTAVNLDKALALFGANPTFANTPTAAEGRQPDVLMANYGARRTKTVDATSDGLYIEIKKAFIKAQAAIIAGSKYNADRDAAIATIVLKWEEINAATVINYLFDVDAKLNAATVTDAAKASAMHSYGECVGFLKGFKGTSKKKITDAQIDDALAKMYQTSPYQLVDDKDKVAQLKVVRDNLQAIYGFTAEQMAEFKLNFVSLEKR